MQRRLLIIALVFVSLVYPGTYAVLRLAQVFTHQAFFTSEEGLNAAYWHHFDVHGHTTLETLFTPACEAELWLWRRVKP